MDTSRLLFNWRRRNMNDAWISYPFQNAGNDLNEAIAPSGRATWECWSAVPRPMTGANRFAGIIHLLNNARLIVMLLDENGVITLVNDHARRASGLEAVELAGHAFIDAMIEDGARQRINHQ